MNNSIQNSPKPTVIPDDSLLIPAAIGFVALFVILVVIMLHSRRR